MFKHEGLTERDLYYKIPLGPLSRDATRILVELPHANFVDIGYVLQRGPARELIQLLHCDLTVHVPPFPFDVARGFNGTTIEDHPADGWLVVVTPEPDMRTPEEKRRDRHAYHTYFRTCPNCGAPNQECEEPCHYCAVFVPVPRL